VGRPSNSDRDNGPGEWTGAGGKHGGQRRGGRCPAGGRYLRLKCIRSVLRSNSTVAVTRSLETVLGSCDADATRLFGFRPTREAPRHKSRHQLGAQRGAVNSVRGPGDGRTLSELIWVKASCCHSLSLAPSYK
jgi:hypothetical protein